MTFNLDDFPDDALKEFEIDVQHPDEFVSYLVDLDAVTVCAVVREQAAALKKPPRSVRELLDTLQAAGLVQTVARLRQLLE